MIGSHLDGATLEALSSRQLDHDGVLDVGWHLTHCQLCRQRLENLAPGLSELVIRLYGDASEEREAPLSEGVYGDVFANLERALRQRRRQRLETEEAVAPPLLVELLDLPADSLAVRLEAEPQLIDHRLIEGLLDRCRGCWADCAAEGEALASLAASLVPRLVESGYPDAYQADLAAQGWAYVGNCRRVQADLLGAEKAFAEAHKWLGKGTGNPLTRGEIHDLEASLLRAKRRFGAAIRALQRAIASYRKAGDEHLVGRALMKSAHVHNYAGKLEHSIRLLNRALERIDPRREPRLKVLALQNLSHYLQEMGHYAEAQGLLPRARAAATGSGCRFDRIRLDWIEGLIAAGTGRRQEAEAILIEVRQQFIEAGIDYDAALVSLDLAALYLRQGRTAETRELAAEMLPIFRSIDIPRETIAALTIFRRAAEIDAAQVELVQSLARQLRHSWSYRQLREETPS